MNEANAAHCLPCHEENRRVFFSEMKGKKILVVAAHPDDELLGVAGTLALWKKQGAEIRTLILATGAESRFTGAPAELEKELKELRRHAQDANAVVGVTDLHFLGFPDNKMDSVPLLEVVQKIEPHFRDFKPDLVLTHHFGDLNIDHQITQRAVVTGLRPQPRHHKPVLMFFETVSSTEWQIAGHDQIFVPQIFVDIGETLDLKVAALKKYQGEMRPAPHARSLENIKNLAAFRGASAGLAFAEAFTLGRLISEKA